MDSEQWAQLQEILAEALERPAEERPAFLEKRCGGDATMRREIESLIVASERAESYFQGLSDRIQSSLDETTGEDVRSDGGDVGADTGFGDGLTEEALIGSQIGDYRVTGVLGKGGMGEVLRAVDTRLHREVALKLLPEHLASSTHLAARFTREARVLASLNHPNIGAIYDLEDLGTRRVLVLELVEGMDLRERLLAGPVPHEEAVDIARQLAEALEAAHDRGIVHRDLKPGNVRITPDGAVKVLDFGIAKAAEPAIRPAHDRSPTATELLAETRPGFVLGTIAYMSPEQIKGRAVDKRTDIWAFGIILFELLAGCRPFGGEDTSETLARIIEREPEWETLPTSTPAATRRLLERCLNKDPRQRLQAIGEARIVLEGGDPGVPAAVVAGAGPASTGHRLRRWIGAAVLAALAAVGAWVLKPAPQAGSPTRTIPTHIARGFVSPDGRLVRYERGGEIWVLSLEDGSSRRLEGTAGALNVFWSWDGDRIGFRRNDRLWAVDIRSGAPPSPITDLPQGIYYQAAWLEDDRIIFSLPAGLFEVPAGGGVPELVLERDAEAEPPWRDPQALPGGGVLFTLTPLGRIELFEDGERRTVFEFGDRPLRFTSYSPSGHILFGLDETELWAVPYSLAGHRITGEAFLVASEINDFSLSRDGSLLAYSKLSRERAQLVWTDRSGKVLETIGEPLEGLAHPRYGPDGNRIVFSAIDGDRRQIWIYDLENGTRNPLTVVEESDEDYPFWEPSGERVGYTAQLGARTRLIVRPADGRGDPVVYGEGPAGGGIVGTYAPDGRHLLYQQRDESTGADLWYRAPDPDSSPVALVRTPQHEGWLQLQPGGDFLAYSGGRTGFPQIFLTTFPTAQGRWQVSSSDGSQFPRWSADGSELFYWVQRSRLMSVRVETVNGTPRIGRPQFLLSADELGLVGGRHFDVAPDGRFLMIKRTAEASAQPALQFMLVENWQTPYEHP